MKSSLEGNSSINISLPFFTMLKEIALSYFRDFSNKDIASLKGFFANDIVLRDWEIEAEGIEAVIEANKNIKFRKLLLKKDVSKLSIIGVGMVTTPGVTFRMFQSLAKKNINIQVISTSEIKISV